MAAPEITATSGRRRAPVAATERDDAAARRRDLIVERVLLVVEAIPAGRVASYGDIAGIVGIGPRQVGSVLSQWGSGVPWWRVTNASGSFPADLLAAAAPHWRAEGILVRPSGGGCRIADYRADLRMLAADSVPGMSSLDDLYEQLPLGQLADMLGVDEATAAQAVRVALPALVGGMAANVDGGGGESLSRALRQHESDDDEYDFGSSDIDDGSRIVDHVFGSERDAVISQLGGTQQLGGISGGLLMKLLPLLAPLVMKFLAKMLKGGLGGLGGSGGGGGSSTPAPRPKKSSSGGYGGDLADSFDKMGTDAPAPTGRRRPLPPPTGRTPVEAPAPEAESSSGGGLGDIFGQILGRGSASAAPTADSGEGSGGGLGGLFDVLGPLLGRGSR